MESTSRELHAFVGDVRLAGSLWSSPRLAEAGCGVPSVVLMIPGSGPSTRDNDVYFPPIRSILLEAGHAVASFDKRGVGGSSGSLIDTSIESQTGDAIACIDAVLDQTGSDRCAVFGHSQGGWVAYEVGVADDRVTRVVSNSGPAVGPAAQERFRLFGAEPDRSVARAAAVFDQLTQLARASAEFHHALPLLHDEAAAGHLAEYIEAGSQGWPLICELFSYDPASALHALNVPTLAIHGDRDDVIPVDDSLAVIGQIANTHITAHVVANGDHRFQIPGTEQLAPGYRRALVEFLDVTDN